MSHRSMNRVMTVFAALAMLVAIAAQTTPAKDTKAGVTTTMSLLNPATFAGKELKPGDYAVSADETHVRISMNGKVVAEAPVQWKDETSRPSTRRSSAKATKSPKSTSEARHDS